jgi:peptide/nickel transport system substrate-binding protein
MKRFRMVLGGLAAAFILFAGSAALAQNDTLVIGVGSEAQNLDPRLATDVASALRTNVMMEGLVTFDRNLGLEPRLATSWELAEDLLSLTFYLREGVTYHNGHPFTSADVRYTFETVLDESFEARIRALYASIESIETPDDHTVIFHLHTPNVFLINNLARMSILPNDPDIDHDMNPIGTGPYKFVSRVRDERLVMERNDDYWGGTGPLVRLEFRVIPENSTRLLAFEAGEIDVTQSVIPAVELARLEADDRFVMERTAGTGYTYLAFNNQVEPLNNPLVRKALNYLVPRQGIVNQVLNGNGFLGISMILPSMVWFNPDVEIYEYNPELARELLEQAGVDFSTPLRLTTSEDAARMQIAEILAFEFGQIGLNIEVEIMEAASFLTRIQQSNDYDLIISGWSGQLDPDRATIRQFHSDPKYGTANYANYSNPRVDELLLQGAATDPTSQKSVEIYQEIQQIVVDESPMAFIYYIEEVALYHPYIEGWSIHPYSPNTFENAHLISKNR